MYVCVRMLVATPCRLVRLCRYEVCPYFSVPVSASAHIHLCIHSLPLPHQQTQEWDATSRHRFRAGDDMQYAFAFYYYLMNLHKARPLDIDVRACRFPCAVLCCVYV